MRGLQQYLRHRRQRSSERRRQRSSERHSRLIQQRREFRPARYYSVAGVSTKDILRMGMYGVLPLGIIGLIVTVVIGESSAIGTGLVAGCLFWGAGAVSWGYYNNLTAVYIFLALGFASLFIFVK